ncbi:MAG: hypothetical protein ACK40L_14035, partial [Hydrogenophaga sp.]
MHPQGQSGVLLIEQLVGHFGSTIGRSDPAQIAALRDEQIAGLETADIAALTSRQLRAFSDGQIGALTTEGAAA